MAPIFWTVLFAKLAAFLIKLSGRGAGATWPGEIALRLRPKILSELLLQAKEQKKTIIFIAGTNGKTTTAKMLETILTTQHKPVVRNASGANLDNGIVSCFIANADTNGILQKDTYIFEVDEATLPNLLKEGSPDVLILMNLFRDQLDRYGEVDTIAENWLKAFQTSLEVSTQLVLNGDDPHLAYIGQILEGNLINKGSKVSISDNHITEKQRIVFYFGLENPELFLPVMEHATDSILCPSCGNRLTFGGVYFSHLGKFACGRCGFKHPYISLSSKEVTSPLEGIYNIYNVLAASLTARLLYVSVEESRKALENFTPAFGRMEKIVYKGKSIRILLSKNPTGWNESIRTVLSHKQISVLLLILNDRIPDGRDVSWIYDVDFEQLCDMQVKMRIQEKRKQKLIHAIDEEVTVEAMVGKQKIIVSGDRMYDLASRLQYAEVSKERLLPETDLEKAIDKGISLTKDHEMLYILPTYSAMLDVRKILTGKKIE